MFVAGAAPISAQPGTPLGTAQLQISGARLTLYSDALTTDAEQTINVGEAARVRTCYGPGAVCGTAGPGAVAGLKVVGDLSGPELPQAIPYETAPGGTFFLPGFQREGDYLLSNVRLVETSSGRVLANAEPSLATLHVRQILLASATVTRLTLADLQARGIILTQQNFKAFSFSVGFLFAGETVTIELPVLFQPNGGSMLPLEKPAVQLEGLSSSARHLVQRWEPPQIVPFSLSGPGGSPENQLDDEPIPDDTPLYGAIVIPGNVSFLNQFFDAKLIVANGAPNGSSATLQNVTGAIRLPTGDYLRLAATSPPVSVGQKLPVLKANGSGLIGPGEQGAVAWTIEGLVAGTQTLRMDIAAELARPGRVTLPLVGSAQAAVEVVDARFNLSFNHPDVVREGEAYSLYVTVTNLSRAAQNLISVELLSENITGAHKADPAESFAKTIPTLDPGASETLEYRLVSDTAGKCVATTFQSGSSGLQGTIHLRTGVGELGIPLSPASLVLPRFSELLPRALITADVRLLGLAYSLAVAPAGAGPAGLPHVIKSDVVRRAVDLGEAGQRLFLQEKLLESLEALALDQLGNRHDLAEYDALRRALGKGAAAATALGDLFRQEQQGRNLTASDFVDHFASTMSYGRPWMAAALVPNGSQPSPTLEVRQSSAAGTTYLAYTSEEPSRLRSLPYGEIYAIHDVPGGSKMPLALVGRLDAAASYRVDLHAPATGASGRLVLVVPSEDLTGFRKVDFGFLTMGASEVWEVRAVKAAGDAALTFGLVFPGSGTPVPGAPAPAITNLTLPPFRLIGAVEDFTLDRYGLGVSYLFNRPPDKASAETASSYVIRSSFHGPDTSSPAITFDKVATKTAGAAFWQPNSERVVNVRYSSPISALQGTADGLPVMRHDHLIATNAIRDTRGTPLDPLVPPALIEPGHTGGLVDGVVRLGTGEPAAGATVQLIRTHDAQTEAGGDPIIVSDLVGEVITGADGAFYFDFIEEPPQNKVQSGFRLRAAVPAGSDPAAQPGGTEEVSTTIRLLNRLVHVNIALLGRGTVKGKLVYADTGAPVPNGQVAAASTLFSEVKSAVAASDGSFTFNALPVGPVTLTGRDDAGNRVYQTVGLQQPGQTVNVLLQLSRSTPPKTGTVIGRVLRQRSGIPRPPPEPSPGALVAVYSNGGIIGQKSADASGNFRFDKVPEGQIQVQAADFSVSRSPALAGAVLVADATVSVVLTISDAAPRVVTGRVLFHDGPTNSDIPVAGAVAFISGPGVFAYTDAAGAYRIEGVPVQGASDPAYKVTAIDFGRQLQGISDLPPILDVGDGSPIRAADIVLRAMTGGIDGVVLDPLGHPAGGVSVQIPHGASASTGADGRFSLNDVGVGTVELVAHAGTGLLAGRIGWFGTGSATIVFAGHRPFATIRLLGSGVVNIHTKTTTSTGVLSPIRYTPTVYRANTFDIGPAPLPVDTTTDPDGRLQLVLPLPGTVVTAFSPLTGNKSAPALLAYPGQVVNLEIVFDSAAAVTGHVVGVDGVTPVPNVDVFLAARGLLPQRQRTDGQGGFRYDLVPPGSVSVTTEALVGSVDRVGRADGRLEPGQTIDLTVVLRAQGTVKGRVVQLVGSSLVPIPFARYTVSESAYPNRRLPAVTGTYAADANGAYEVSHLFAGPITVVGSDPAQPARQGRATAEITADFQVLQMPDIVLTTSVGSLGVLVRDPATGGPVPDCQVTLSNGDVTVSDALGQASFDALPLGTYSVYAFHAPTGQGGLVSGLRLASAGDHVDATITLDTRGQISGTLWDDPAKTLGVGNGTVQLTGRVHGRLWGTSLTALASTSAAPATLGQFLFDGIPAGSFTLLAAVPDSARRAATALDLTATAPVAAVDLVLEQLGDRYVRVFQNLKAPPHLFELDPSTGIFTVELTQPQGTCAPSCTYDFLLNAPTVPYPNHLYRFGSVYVSRPLGVVAREAGGEQRSGSIAGLANLPGAGTAADPFRVVLGAKGVVNILVRDGGSNPAPGANVTLTTSASGNLFASTTDGTGRVTFDAIPAGNLTVSARLASNGSGGLAAGVLTYDDESVDLTVSLAPAVSAHGVVYHPPPGDVFNGDPTSLVPEDKAIVQIRDSASQLQVVQTGPDGKYRFDALKTGAYTISATNQTGEALASSGGTLAGPNGNDNALPDLILDASRPLIVSLTPPPGQTGVSRNAFVEIVFSEPLLASVLPAGAPTSPYFALRSGLTGLFAPGTWTSLLNPQGQQVVRFTPSSLYDNSTVYSLTIAGGSGGVRDRAGRPLTDAGDVGSNFTTSDTVGASVVASVPPLSKPVDPASAIRFDFSEVVTGTAADLDVSNPSAAAQLFWQANGSSVWQPLPLDSMFLTRGGYSLTIQPLLGVTLTNDSLKRRVRVSRLKDLSGNPMVDYDQTYRIWDANAPHVDASFPPGAPTGNLSAGTLYTITPVLSNLDDLASGPGGDLDRVDYFLASASDPAAPATTPVYSGRTQPFAFSFVGAYVGNGVDPRPFPVWVQAVDTSTNKSNVVKLAMQVLPNAAPVIAAVAAAATAPAAGMFYAGSSLAATVSGVADPDGGALTLTAELRKNNPVSANDPADLVASLASQALTRPAGGWAALPPPVFTSAIPIAMADGTALFFRVKATDSLGASATTESARFAVLHDPNPPAVDSFVARLSGASSPASQFFIGQKLVLEFRARDAETAVRTTSIALSGVFASPLAATLVGGTTNLYRTAELTVPATVPPGGLAVTATASATDWGGNTGTLPLSFNVSPTPDPYAPVATWLTPWEGGAWPSGYASTVSPLGTALLLRVKVSDYDRVAGLDVPGTIARVQFRGPADAAGTLAPAFVDGSLVAGTGGPGTGIYEALWRVPNGVAPGAQLTFEVRVVDAGANATVADAHLRAVPPRKVYEAAQVAALPADPLLGAGGDVAGPVFVLDGAVLSLYPQASPAVRSVPSMFVYAGGVAAGASFTPSASVLTAPEITSYASSVLYNPLELTVTDTFGLGHGARVDVSAKGLLGSTPTQSMVLPGQTGAQQYAGGSHGGSGGPGSPFGWARTDLYSPGSVFDSVKDPSLPGGGGGYATGGTGTTPTGGGTGGGVARLLAPGATVHLDGNVLADGGDGPGGFTGGGGAGGAVRIVAARLEGGGSISAAGGRGTSGNYAGGGGGGRIALSFADPPAAALALKVSAPGGFNDLPLDSSAQQVGGAGTVYLEELDALGAPKAPGKLILRNASGKPAWPTPFAAAQRFGSVEGHGAARPVFADDLTLGPDPGVVNNRASVLLDPESRLLLKTEGPQISLNASPDGGNVNVNQTLTLTWTASDPIGLFSLTKAFSPQAPATTAYADEPLTVTQGATPLTLTVPAAQPPGPITYTLTATDRAGRVTTVQKTWTVLADTTPPVVSVSGLVAGGVYHAGQTVSGTVTATDNGSIASVKVLVDGQTMTLTGAGPTYPFSYLVPRDLASARDTTLQAVVTDAAGNTASTTAVALHFLLDAPPTLNLTGVTPGPSVLPGATLTATANASDDVGVATVVFTLSGAVSTVDTRAVNALSTAQSFSYLLPLVLTGGQTVTLQVDVLDSYGHKVSASPVTYTILNVGPPSKLAFGTQPSDTGVGASITPAVSVRILDDAGNQTMSTASVTISIGTNPGGGTLSGTLTVAAVAGVATFGNLSIDRLGVGYTLAAAGAGLTGATSSPFNINGALVVETAADGSGTAVPAQSITAGSTLSVYAVSRDSSNKFLTNVVPDSWSLAGITGGVVSGDLVASPAGSFATFSIPTSGSYPRGITAGPDGNLWFAEYSANRIGRITTAGVVTEFPIPTASSGVVGITAGPDGNLWFTEQSANKIGRITTAGVVTEFSVPAGSQPYGIATGPDGNLWFAEYMGNKIGRITTAGLVTEFPIPTPGSQPFGIVAGPDGNLWFAEALSNKIGRITTTGVVTEFTIPAASSGIAAGPDGNLWFTESTSNKIGRITTAGAVTEYPIPTASSGPGGIAAGLDGNLWFGETNLGKVGRITTAGVITEFAVGNGPYFLASGRDGAVWFGGITANWIGRITTGGSATFAGHLAGSATVHAAKAGLTSTDSGTLTVVPGAASKLAFGTPPSSTIAGSPIAPAVTVRIVDAGGNLIASAASVTVAIGTNPGGGALSGPLTVAAAGGVATFNGLSIDKAGTGYTLTAASSGLTGATSSSFDILPRPATQMAFGTPPSNTPKGAAITPAVKVRILDDVGNLTASTAPVTVAIAANPAGGTLSGTLTVAAVAGVATFSDLSIDKLGTGYTMTATSAGLTGATSSTFAITAGPATKFRVETSPDGSGTVVPAQTVAAGTSLAVYAISRDAGDNFVANVTPDGWSLTGITGGVAAGDLIANAAGAFAEFPIPGQPHHIVAGPDGNLWLTEPGANKIGRITPGGVFVEFSVPTANSQPLGVAAGPDGNLWFTENNANKIGRITTAGVITEFPIPTSGSRPNGITAGPDGNLWFTEQSANKIARITTVGVVTEFSIPSSASQPYGIAAGPDGNIWFTESSGNRIGRITPGGVVTEFPIPAANSVPYGIAAGPDGNIWFTEFAVSRIGRITPGGVVTEFPIPSSFSQPYGIVAGLDGNVWFVENASANRIGRVTTAGVFTEFPIPTAFSTPTDIAAGPDGNFWFTENGTNKVGRIATGGSATFTGHLPGSAAIHAAKAGLASTDSGILTVPQGAPSKLVFGTPPSTAAVGAVMVPPVTVKIMDASGYQPTTSTAPVTLAIGTNPGGGTLSGTRIVAAVDGVATFSDLSIDRFGTGYTLTAASAGLTGTTSVTFNITAGAATQLRVETAANGSGTVVPIQNITAGSSLTVYAIARDAGNNFTGNVTPDAWSLAGATGGVVAGDLVASGLGTMTEFPTPTANSIPIGIAAGPDGRLWFTESNGSRIGRLTTAGVFTEFPTPTSGSRPAGIAAGPDGNLWFTEVSGNKIGRITPAGAISEFPLSTSFSSPNGIAAGPDGALWFTESGAYRIGRITTGGVITEFPLSTVGSGPTMITAGSDGNLWFIESGAANKIGRITTAGIVTEFPIPTASSGPSGIVAGPDGNLWFTEQSVNKIGRLTPAGAFTEFPTPAGSSPNGIVAGLDGNLWFTEYFGSKIGRISPAGVVTEFTIPTAGSQPQGIAAGPDGNLWFVESAAGASKIGRLATGASATFTGHQPGSAVIHAARAGLTPTDSGTLTVVEGPASGLVFGTQPSSTTAGVAITPAVTVRILDAGGNQTTSTASVTVAIGTNVGGGTLSGTLTVAAVAGVATFSDLSIDKAGAGYTLTVSSAGLTGSTSSSFNVTVGPASRLAFGTQPSYTPVGSAITPAVTVRIVDAGGNQTSSTASVTVAIGTNPGGGTLSGTLTVAAVAGVATFSDLSIDRFGTGYTLTAASTGLTGGTSATFRITAGAAAKILVETAADGSGTVVPAQNITAGGSLTVYAISRDASGNFVANVTPDSWSLAGISGGVVAEDLAVNALGAMTEFPVPTSGSRPLRIAAGPDGRLWFTESSGSKIGRITPAGVFTESSTPTSGSGPGGIVAGPDGNLWFTETSGNKIGRITTGGAISEFPIPTAGSAPVGIAAGPDGNLWFTEYNGNKIGRITTAGVVTEFPVPTASSSPNEIAAGPDGNLWFTEYAGNKIGRITTAGVVTEFAVPTAASSPYGIAAGPDGNLWFTEFSGNKVGRITPAGVVTEFPVPTASSSPDEIAAGPDGNLWFVEYFGNKVGRITPAGVVTEFPIPTANALPYGIAAGPDGSLWFTESSTNKIGRIATGGTATFTGHLPGSAAIHVSRAGLASTDSGTLTVVTGSSLTILGVTLCAEMDGALKPGASFVACADTDARDVTLEISGAFEATIAGYGNCRDPIAIPGSARPGPLKIVASARDAEGRSTSATVRALVVADERAPVLVSVVPAPGAAFRSGDALRVAVETWDDVGIASVAIAIGGTRMVLTAPPFEVFTLAPPVASSASLPVLVEVFDPSGNVSRRTLDLGVLPAGARLPQIAPAGSAPGVLLEDGRLTVDGGWPWRDADGETRGRLLELPAIGTHTVLGADGAVVALDGPVARAAVHGGSVNVLRGGALVGQFGILSVSEDGLVLRLEGAADGNVRRGDFLEGIWVFGGIDLARGAILRATDAVDAAGIRVDASSLFLSKNLQIPSSIPGPSECPVRGPRAEPTGTPPASAGGVAP